MPRDFKPGLKAQIKEKLIQQGLQRRVALPAHGKCRCARAVVINRPRQRAAVNVARPVIDHADRLRCALKID